MRCLLLVAFAPLLAAQPLKFTLQDEALVQQHLRLANRKNAERYRRLKALLNEAGCLDDALREQRVKGSKEPNMICAVIGSGENPRRIIVGAHFDSAGSEGVIDNWSGAVLLPSLLAELRRSAHKHTFEFVAFAAEEKGLRGSRAYLNSLSMGDRSQVDAVITLDCVGLTPTKFWPNGSTENLMSAAAAVARTLKLDFQGVNVEQVGTTDSQVFKDAGMPVLSLHSVTPETLPILIRDEGDWASLSWTDYYDTYRFVAGLLVYLDRDLP